ncbi:MAG: hypothetical protein IRZ21_02135 [Thermoleophilaceae bacterium]|nr:hypothetical protein [Thermoleophilaceae bacterium]
MIDPTTQGVPYRTGKRVARFETTPDDIAHQRWHAKLFKAFTDGKGHPPADVSGVYRVWYYLPTTYRVPNGTSVNALQFKDDYRKSDGSKQSDPLWWINFGNAGYWSSRGGPRGLRSDYPVAYINNWGGTHWNSVKFMAVPLGRWVEFRAEVHQNDRIDFYIDGKLLDTARASEYPVRPFHSSSIDYTFGIGNYSSGANGPLYADDASYSKP